MRRFFFRKKRKEAEATPDAKDRQAPARGLRDAFRKSGFFSPDRVVNEMTGHTRLIAAVVASDADEVLSLLEQGADPNKVSKDGKSALHHAARQGNREIADILLGHGADPDMRDKTLSTPLSDALLARTSEDMLALLLEKGASAGIPDADGRLPLHKAAARLGPEAILLLLRSTENPDTPDKNGMTPLMAACETNDLESVKAVLFERVNILAADRNGMTCLHFAAMREKGDIAEHLLGTEATALLNAVTMKGRSPLHLAAARKKEKLALSMIGMGACINLVDEDGMTPLHDAIGADDLNLAKKMIDRGADPGLANGAIRHKMPPLHLAIRGNNIRAARMLLDAGADANVADTSDLTPLMAAAFRGNGEMVGLLLESGADPTRTDHLRRNVLHHCAPQLPEKAFTSLIAAGADPNHRDKWGRPALLAAVQEHNLMLSFYLLRHGADPNLCDDEGITPLQAAVRQRKITLIPELLEKGADPNAQDKNTKMSALHVAAMLEMDFECETLLKHKADPNLKDHLGRTPLHLALLNNYRPDEIVRMLLKNGADPLVRDNRDVTAYDLAHSYGRMDVIALFKDHLDRKGIRYTPRKPPTPPWGGGLLH